MLLFTGASVVRRSQIIKPRVKSIMLNKIPTPQYIIDSRVEIRLFTALNCTVTSLRKDFTSDQPESIYHDPRGYMEFLDLGQKHCQVSRIIVILQILVSSILFMQKYEICIIPNKNPIAVLAYTRNTPLLGSIEFFCKRLPLFRWRVAYRRLLIPW